MSAIITVIGMYQWYPTLFDNMSIPTELDKEVLTDNLMMELGELEVVYSDPDFMLWAIERWSLKEFDRWVKLYETTVLDYDPIENYNRVETSNEKETRALAESDLETRALNGSNVETRALTGSSTNSGTDSMTKSKTGFDEGTLQVVDQEDNVNGLSTAITDAGTVNNAITDAGTINNAKTDTGTVDHETTSTIKGNIGVTTSQQMIEQERKILEFNMYSHIIQDFKLRFCIMKW